MNECKPLAGGIASGALGAALTSALGVEAGANTRSHFSST